MKWPSLRPLAIAMMAPDQQDALTERGLGQARSGLSGVASPPHQEGSQVVAAIEQVLDLSEVALAVLLEGEDVVHATQ